MGHGFLVDRRGDDGSDVAVHRHASGPLHGFHGEVSGFGLHTARNQSIDFNFRRVYDVDRAVAEQAGIGMVDPVDRKAWIRFWAARVVVVMAALAVVVMAVVVKAVVIGGSGGPGQRQGTADDFIMSDDQRAAKFVDPFL